MKKSSEVMTHDPICCLSTDTASKAAQLMRVVDVGSIPVVEDEQTLKLIGIVTDRDLAMRVVADGHSANLTRVADVMTREVITCRASDDVQKAVDAMSQHQLRRMPIIDDDYHIVGIISQADVATRVEKSEEIAEMVKEISQPTA
jgi:CBS domain-containing protein